MVNLFLLQLFDSASQTLLPAEDLKKRFEQEGILSPLERMSFTILFSIKQS